MLTYEALELTVWTYPSLCKKKKGKCWKKKNTLENDSLFILKQSGLTDLHPFTDQKIYPEHATSQGSQI